MWLNLFFIILLANIQLAAYPFEDRVEGLFSAEKKRDFLASCFLPFNPTILFVGSANGEENPFRRYLPLAKLIHLNLEMAVSRLNELPPVALSPIDLIWLESGDPQVILFENLIHLVNEASVIYLPTCLRENGTHFESLKFLLSLCHFTLLTHWFREGEGGHALFLKKELYEATMRSLNYTPSILSSPIETQWGGNLENYFKSGPNKSPYHFIDQIDYIYMINLDERPEKFKTSIQQLGKFGINPYRFSAVNGWKLPFEAFHELGVRFPTGTLHERFRGTVYREEEGLELSSNEYLQENGDAYFTLGLSRGAIGIVLSHLSILQDAYNAGYQTIWVMEDDIEVIEDPRSIPDLIRKLDAAAPGWDILFTDTDTKDSNGHHVPCRALAARPNYPIEPISSFLEKFYPLGEEFSRIGMRYGAYSMILRRSGIEKILKFFKAYQIFLPYDLDFWLIPQLKMYALNQDIVSHLAGAPSDNSHPNYLSNNP